MQVFQALLPDLEGTVKRLPVRGRRCTLITSGGKADGWLGDDPMEAAKLN